MSGKILYTYLFSFESQPTKDSDAKMTFLFPRNSFWFIQVVNFFNNFTTVLHNDMVLTSIESLIYMKVKATYNNVW